jgi:phosphate transport system substrate-binding protein
VAVTTTLLEEVQRQAARPPNRPGSYPIVLATYEIVCSKYPDSQVGVAVKAFLQSTIGAGQNGLADNGYIPISDGFKSRLSTAVNPVS